MKFITFIRFVLVACCSAFFLSCENSLPDYYHEKEFNLADFDQIKLGDAFQIEIMEAEEFLVIAKGEDRDLNDLILAVEGGMLTGRYRTGSRGHKRTLIQIYLPELRKVDVYGASTSRISGFESSENTLTLHVSGASEAHFNGSSKNLLTSINGASLLALSGETENLTAEVHGASELRAKFLKTEVAQMQIHSNSNASVEVLNRITGGVHGRSSLLYYGNPELVQVNVETGSAIIRGL